MYVFQWGPVRALVNVRVSLGTRQRVSYSTCSIGDPSES